MSYSSFSFDKADADQPASTEGAAIDATFSRTEWLVIRLARENPSRTRTLPSWLAGISKWLFGVSGANRLADPRLETLRQTASSLWHSTADAAVHARLSAVGYSQAQIARLVDHVSEVRPAQAG